MPNDQNTQTQVKDGLIIVTKITSNSISVKWDPATTAKPDPYRYQIGLTLENDPWDPWHIVDEVNEVYKYTFTGLKSETSYAIFVKAYDGDELVVQYPLFNGCMTAKTLAPDTEAPKVDNLGIFVKNIKTDGFTIEWEPATDNVTAADKIRYEVWLKRSNTPTEPWGKVADRPGLTSYTFTGLAAGTMYSFFVRAFDESGNRLQYPLDNGCMTAKTLASVNDTRVNKLNLSITQNATVLYGTKTISVELTYNKVQYNAKGQVTAREAGSWNHKWSSRGRVDTVIDLPDNWYFENNKVHVRVRSRRAASAGLNRWKTCSEGDLPLSGDTLKIKLTGNYYDYNVKYTQV